jgi:small subunit ribosomal protein S4
MSRYRGAKLRIVRRLGELPGLTSKTSKLQTPPGQHGAKNQKPSQYGIRLMEKQKLRYNYGLTEHKLMNYVRKAKKMQGSTGELLLQLLEMRLDNTIFRLGMAPTVAAARQLVSHGHIQINGASVDIPSFQVKPGMQISVHPHKQSKALVTSYVESLSNPVPSHLTFNKENLSGQVNAIVSRQDVSLNINELLIIEFYSRQV